MQQHLILLRTRLERESEMVVSMISKEDYLQSTLVYMKLGLDRLHYTHFRQASFDTL